MPRYLTCVLLLSSLCGCATINAITGRPTIERETARNRAVTCLCLWEEGKGQDAEGHSARGFVGQIYFFNARAPSPVAVDGDVRIFLFDDAGPEDDQTQPLHQYDYVNGAWDAFLSESEIGTGYSVFVPYPRKGHDKASCSLRLRLTRTDDSRVFSDMAQVSLGGTRVQETPDGSVADLGKTVSELPQKLRLKSETIGTREDGNVYLASGTSSEDRSEQTPATNGTGIREDRLREILEELKRERQVDQTPEVDLRVSARELFEGQPEEQTATSSPDPTPDATGEEESDIEIMTLSRPLTREASSQSEAEPVGSARP